MQGLRVTVRMPFVQHVTLLRLECEFDLYGGQLQVLPTALCYAAVTDTTSSLALALKFNLLSGVPQTVCVRDMICLV